MIKKLSSFRLAWVQAFLATLNYGTATAAAREIGCNPSAISRHLKELSAWLGGKVFEGNNNLKLTPLGEAFYPEAVKLMDWAIQNRNTASKIEPEGVKAEPLGSAMIKRIKRSLSSSS